MSLNELLKENPKEWCNIFVNNCNIDGSLITNNLNIKNISNSLVSTPNAGYQTIFANSDNNNNLTSKNSNSSLISLSSALSNFIVSNNPNDGMKYLTIQSAINDAILTGNNETIIIRPGIYNEDITMYDKINLVSMNPDLTVSNNPVTITGTVTINVNGNVSINNLSFSRDNGNCINISGTNTININNCNFKTTTSGDCIYVNDVNSFVICRDCNFISTPVPNYFINTNACNQMVLFNCLVGAINSAQGKISHNSGLLPILYSVLNSTIIMADNCLCLVFNSFFSLGDVEAFNLNGPGSTLICTNTTIISDASSSTDFITGGAGNLIKSLISLLGRSTVSGGISVSSFVIF